MEGTRDPCLLREQFCWHPVLPDPAPPPRRAPRPDPPVACPGFELYNKLHTISFVRASEESFRTIVFDALGGRGTVAAWANRPVGVRSCPLPPRTAALLWAAPNRSARVMTVFWIRQVPGHALHEKGLQKQKGDSPLFSSQEQRALLVPVINRLSTGCQPVVVFLHLFS